MITHVPKLAVLQYEEVPSYTFITFLSAIGRIMGVFMGFSLWSFHSMCIAPHSPLRRNLMKVWKTWTGLSLGGRAWSTGPKSAMSKFLQNKEHYQRFSKTEFKK